MRDGDILEVLSDNPCCAESIAGLCDVTGDEILEQDREKGTYRFKIRKLDLRHAA
jgi:TusA-related sulfurtransferase